MDWQLSLRKDRQASVAFLERLRHTWPEAKVVVGLDNGGSHKSRQTFAWGQPWRRQLCPFFLPAYPPEWHLRERVWRSLKEQRSGHRGWADWQRLWAATTALLAHLTARFHHTTRPGIDVVQNFCASA